MLKKAKLHLFWFLKRDAVFDLDDPRARQIYAQQILTCGRAEDVKELLRDIGPNQLRESFEQMKRFLPQQVRMFWEDFAPESNHFYLTGGTALAHFYLQHRKSKDLDFFTSEELSSFFDQWRAEISKQIS